MEVAHYIPRALRVLGFLIFSSLYCAAAIAQEQTVSGSLSVPELRVGQSTDLTLSYTATDNAKTSGLGLRLHFDSSSLEMGATSDKLRESAQPFQIQNDTSDFDNNPVTDKFFLTSWADFSGVGWPDTAAQPVTLYVVPLTAKVDFAGEVLAFSGYSAPGYTLVAADITIVKAETPVITLLGEAEVSLELGSTYTDAGATAVDNIDGDITANIVTINPVDVNTVGTYTVTYNVSDAAGNAAIQVTRTVNITPDVTIPVITLSGEAEVSLELGSIYTDAGATAVDNIDGDITANIVTVNAVDVNTVGTYTVTYNVSDAAGNAASQISRTVNITPDVTIPIITLLGEVEVSLELGSTYTDAGATAADNFDGDITASIAVFNPVDVNTVGTYTVTFNVSDAAGNLAVPVLRQVMVSGIIDIDRNGHYDALTDGLLLLRSIFGLDGDALVFGAVASNATVTSSQDILVEIDRLGMLLDIDGNGVIDALTDGLLILRYLFGLEGDILIAGVVAQNATRATAAEI
ncbi:DUF5011 domain-containing protein, partial [Porticoccaceae bacterium]|nr:DUF5011 domain-containing protein [Porticoccaceae bacterium]